jgi:hypothetical protein
LYTRYEPRLVQFALKQSGDFPNALLSDPPAAAFQASDQSRTDPQQVSELYLRQAEPTAQAL